MALKEALRRAAEAVREWSGRDDLQARDKSGAGDPVTQGDLASQEAILSVIDERCSGDLVVSEETPDSHLMIDDPTFTGWVIDPIDGTNNFARGIAYYCVSIAWVEEGAPSLAGVIDPNSGQLYWAKQGCGAWLDSRRLEVSRANSFGLGTRVATSNIIASGGTWPNLDRLQLLGDIWIDITGSTVLQMAELAAGRVDLFCHSGLKPWDSAGAFLLVAEAGGRVVDLRGGKADWRRPEVLAGNPVLVDQFLKLLGR